LALDISAWLRGTFLRAASRRLTTCYPHYCRITPLWQEVDTNSTKISVHVSFQSDMPKSVQRLLAKYRDETKNESIDVDST
jgi:hypothetical protein